jgi:hypothetical protein
VHQVLCLMCKHKDRRPVYHCQDCFGGDLHCHLCLLLFHAKHPLHRIEVLMLYIGFYYSVWLPIALTCRICHNAQYRDTHRTLWYHYILATTPLPRTITLNVSSHRPINTDGLLTAYTHLCHDARYRDAYRTLQYH